MILLALFSYRLSEVSWISELLHSFFPHTISAQLFLSVHA